MKSAKQTRSLTLATLAVVATTLASALPAATLKVNGSTTVNPVVTEAAEILGREKGLVIRVDTQGGSSGGISGVGDGSGDVGMSSKPILDSDRAKFPGVDFVPTKIGEDAVALVVSRDVWEGGVRALSRDQLRAIYEARITNWKEVGGPDRRIVFFNKEPGRGTWEVFAHWVYGDSKKAPVVSHREVGGNEEGRTKVATTRGAMTQLSWAWAEESGGRVLALGVRLDDGSVVRAAPATIANGSWPMSRPLLLITNGPPTNEARELVEFLLGARGQALVKKHGYLPVSANAGTGSD